MKCVSDSVGLTFQILVFITSYLATEANMQFTVDLILPRYVMVGGSALLQCKYSVRMDQLHRVEWLRNTKKLFQFVKGRKPAFRNYSIPGAEIDMSQSNERQIVLKNMDFEASGFYSCEVSTETPIYTKPSNDHELLVIQMQREPPHVSTSKHVYQVGETLEANCTTSPARPLAHVTWLVNEKPVEESQLRIFPHRDRERLTAQLSLEVSEMYRGNEGNMELTCLATIPAFLDSENSEFADKKSSTISVEIQIPESSSRANSCKVLLLVASLFILLR